MAHFYVYTIVFLTVQQTIAVPRQRMTQCEQWNNEDLFSLSLSFSVLLPGGEKKKKKKNWAGIIIFLGCDLKMLRFWGVFVHFSREETR